MQGSLQGANCARDSKPRRHQVSAAIGGGRRSPSTMRTNPNVTARPRPATFIERPESGVLWRAMRPPDCQSAAFSAAVFGNLVEDASVVACTDPRAHSFPLVGCHKPYCPVHVYLVRICGFFRSSHRRPIHSLVRLIHVRGSCWRQAHGIPAQHYRTRRDFPIPSTAR